MSGIESCRECGVPNAVWFTDDDVWNRVVGDEDCVLCVRCFMERASARQGGLIWYVTPDLTSPGSEYARGVQAGIVAGREAGRRELAAQLLHRDRTAHAQGGAS